MTMRAAVVCFAAVAVACLAGCAPFVPPPAGDGKLAITSFAFLAPPVAGSITEDAHAVDVEVPAGTDLTALVAVFVASGSRVSVAGVEQVSGRTPNDFSGPVEYVVEGSDGARVAYVVRVTAAQEALSAEKSFTSFSFQSPGAAAVIDEGRWIVHARVADGTELSSLIAVFTTTGACVRVAGKVQESGVTVNDFSSPVEYEVVAEDGSSCRYTVLVAGRIGLLINELDVDQVGVDNAEYIELLAVGDADLWGIVVVLIHGGVTPGKEYARIDLSSLGSIEQGSYLVVAGPLVQVPPPAVKYTPQGWELTNRIQNGPSDAVMLWDTIGRKVIDTVSYAGALHRAVIEGETMELDATEGNTGAPADSNSVTGSLSRSPNGQDTGQNSVDFRFVPALTPGGPNP
jgi:hypothetical protein